MLKSNYWIEMSMLETNNSGLRERSKQVLNRPTTMDSKAKVNMQIHIETTNNGLKDRSRQMHTKIKACNFFSSIIMQIKTLIEVLSLSFPLAIGTMYSVGINGCNPNTN